MITVLTILLIACLALWFAHCLDRFIHAEEIVKHELWEEENMVDWTL